MHYFNIVDWLFQPFTTPGLQVFHSLPFSEFSAKSPDAIVLTSRVQYETVFRIYFLLHGFSFWEPMAMHLQTVLGFSMVSALSAASDEPRYIVEALRSTLALCLQGILENAKRCYLGEATFLLLRDANKSQEWEARSDSILSNDHRKELLTHHLRSEFLVNITSIAVDPKSNKIENLLAAYKEIESDIDAASSASEDDPIRN
jgi:hypothetical protein